MAPTWEVTYFRDQVTLRVLSVISIKSDITVNGRAILFILISQCTYKWTDPNFPQVSRESSNFQV